MVVDFAVLPPLATEPVGTPLAHELAVQLLAAASNTSSDLYTGNVTRLMDVSSAISTRIIVPTAGDLHVVRLSPELLLGWSLQGNAISFVAEFSGGLDRWFSVAVNDVLSMVRADSVVYQPAQALLDVSQYGLLDRTLWGIVPVAPSDRTVSDVVVSRNPDANRVTIEWTRPLAAGSYSGAQRINPESETHIVWAMGYPSHGLLAPHAVDACGGGSANLRTGAYNSSNLSSRRVLWIVHGVLMALAWLVFFPSGILIARYGRKLTTPHSKRPVWFLAHWVLQFLGFMTTIAALGVALDMTTVDSHFAHPHNVFGLVLVCMCAAQVLLGMFRPSLPARAGEPVTRCRAVWEVVHKGLGYLLFLAGVCNVFMGLARAGAVTALYIVAACLVFALLLTYGVLYAVFQQEARRKKRVAVLTSRPPPSALPSFGSAAPHTTVSQLHRGSERVKPLEVGRVGTA
ncbi:hypothetical protein EON66_07210 [archaeon]|nr:MAG: hypothetical protein EON66_07210 [archaeon]